MIWLQIIDCIINLFSGIFYAYDSFHEHLILLYNRPLYSGFVEKNPRSHFFLTVEFCDVLGLIYKCTFK